MRGGRPGRAPLDRGPCAAAAAARSPRRPGMHAAAAPRRPPQLAGHRPRLAPAFVPDTWPRTLFFFFNPDTLQIDYIASILGK